MALPQQATPIGALRPDSAFELYRVAARYSML